MRIVDGARFLLETIKILFSVFIEADLSPLYSSSSPRLRSAIARRKKMAGSTAAGRAILTSVLLFFLFSFFCFSPGNAFADEQREFDYFALSLQWPGTICQRTHHCCPSNGCCQSSLMATDFTIHGLWPDYDDGSWPACCGRSGFDLGKIMSLLEVLQKHWPSLSCSSSSDCHGGRGIFWAHEWEKHGTCSYPVIQDEYSYFSTTLDLYFKYNITKMLNDAGYTPNNGQRYPLGGIVSAIKDAFGATPLLVCKHGAVEELRICFYKDFKPRDCINGYSQVDKLSSRSSCPKYVSLPEYTPIKLEDGNATIPWLPGTEIL